MSSKKAVDKKTTEATYSFNEVGERTKTEPGSGAATTYGYNQAGVLTSLTRPKSGETAAIEDSYSYNGDGLLSSQTISGTTSYLTWDTGEELPLLLNDGTNSYIYGPADLPVEQISSTGTMLYLHHELGSTRLLTGETGKDEGAYSYEPYGGVEEHTGTATTPLGYDGQYQETGTGLLYLRARYYDTATGQFLSVDLKVAESGAPYSYGADDPVRTSDATGECAKASAAEIAGPHRTPASKSNCNKWWNEAKRKYNFLRSKEEDLKTEGPESSKAVVEGHVKSWNEKVVQFRNVLKKFQTGGCEDEYGLKVPAEAYELAETELRVKDYQGPIVE